MEKQYLVTIKLPAGTSAEEMRKYIRDSILDSSYMFESTELPESVKVITMPGARVKAEG